MAENSVFFEAVVAQRSMLVDEEEALEGTATLSLETQTDMAESDVLTYIENNFPDFLKNLRYLSKEDQELLLSYYVLSKTQANLALLHRSTQTLCSARIRMAMQKMGTFMMLGPPTADTMRDTFLALGLENQLARPLSIIVEMYAETRSFQRVAEVLNLHRPDVRRVMSSASKTLFASRDTKHKALGSYIFDLIDKASAQGLGYSKRKMAKQGHLHVKDPDTLGMFRISVLDPNFVKCFVSRANC